MNCRLVIFDLDGTVLDTLDDLTSSVNAALAHEGMPPRSRREVRAFVGNGIRRLVERAVPEGTDADACDRVYGAFCMHYERHCADATRPFGGVAELLGNLRANGMRAALVSNKADGAVRKLCENYFPGLLDAAAGEREGMRRKPEPDMVLDMLRRLGVSAEDAVYVGDSEVDVQTARNAGTDLVAVDWGFRSRGELERAGARVIVSSPDELERELMRRARLK